MPLLEAVRQSGARRLRPSLLTTLTTALALMPMALGLAGVSKSYGPFAAALTFGLMVAMLGTLFAVPLSYTSLILLQERLGQRFRRRAAPAVAATEAGVEIGTPPGAAEGGAKSARVSRSISKIAFSSTRKRNS